LIFLSVAYRKQSVKFEIIKQYFFMNICRIYDGVLTKNYDF